MRARALYQSTFLSVSSLHPDAIRLLSVCTPAGSNEQPYHETTISRWSSSLAATSRLTISVVDFAQSDDFSAVTIVKVAATIRHGKITGCCSFVKIFCSLFNCKLVFTTSAQALSTDYLYQSKLNSGQSGNGLWKMANLAQLLVISKNIVPDSDQHGRAAGGTEARIELHRIAAR